MLTTFQLFNRSSGTAFLRLDTCGVFYYVILWLVVTNGDYWYPCAGPCAHYVLEITPEHNTLCSRTHYDITMGNDIARYANCNTRMGNDVVRDIHYDVTMSNDVAMCTSQCILMLLWTSFIIYYYTYLSYWCFTSKPLESISNQ